VDRTRLARRATSLAVITIFITTSAGQASAATTAVRRALIDRHATVEHARKLQRLLRDNGNHLNHLARRARIVLETGPGPSRTADPQRWRAARQAAQHRLKELSARGRGLRRWVEKRLAATRAKYHHLNGWLSWMGIFRTCPVPDYTTIYNNFGVVVRIPHVPVHIHQGDDVMAPYGTPIIAPFDGYATTGWSKLGGLEVRVTNDRGYVYNAHLSELGRLGYVHAGDVVGYVGATGDATGPHDHFEWHPMGGPAVDPYPYLVAACVPAA
jgi:murein DD-endopeptidase MepM/ murein hydrolase activator NlpD